MFCFSLCYNFFFFGPVQIIHHWHFDIKIVIVISFKTIGFISYKQIDSNKFYQFIRNFQNHSTGKTQMI